MAVDGRQAPADTCPPKGNRNAWKNGFYSHEQIVQRLRINTFFRECLQKDSPDWAVIGEMLALAPNR